MGKVSKITNIILNQWKYVEQIQFKDYIKKNTHTQQFFFVVVAIC